jgi:uncharacterized RDD family membrane protein YckC
MALCSSCGGENADGTRFCVRCGAGLSAAPSPGSWQTPTGDLYGNPSGQVNSAPYSGGAAAYSAYGTPYGSAPQQPSAYPPVGANPYAQQQPNSMYSPQVYAQQAPWMAASQAGMKADPGMRILSFVVDALAWAVVVAIIAVIPIFGVLFALFLAPLLTGLYHLLRDSQGASLGKSLFGMKVIGKDGREATTGARILRNLLFAIPAFIMIVPILGHVLGGFLAFVIVITELISLLASGERLGDKLANTVVIKTK